MAQYKVPQDVEADDKLLGPFTARQLLYLGIAFGAGALLVGLFYLSSILGLIFGIILVPVAIFFAILALPLRKDQPTEVYIKALYDFYKKPKKRFWNPGQRESTILITAPKKVEAPRTRDLTEDEAGRRLMFLADIVDSEGQSIKGNWSPQIKEEYITEAKNAPDMFESYSTELLDKQVNNLASARREDIISSMRATLEGNASLSGKNLPKISTSPFPNPPVASPQSPQAPASRTIASASEYRFNSSTIPKSKPAEDPAKKAAMEELSKNTDFSVATIAKEAERIKKSKDGEIYISLH